MTHLVPSYMVVTPGAHLLYYSFRVKNLVICQALRSTLITQSCMNFLINDHSFHKANDIQSKAKCKPYQQMPLPLSNHIILNFKAANLNLLRHPLDLLQVAEVRFSMLLSCTCSKLRKIASHEWICVLEIRNKCSSSLSPQKLQLARIELQRPN